MEKKVYKFWRGSGEKETLLHCWWEYKLVQPLLKTVWRFLKKKERERLHAATKTQYNQRKKNHINKNKY